MGKTISKEINSDRSIRAASKVQAETPEPKTQTLSTRSTRDVSKVLPRAKTLPARSTRAVSRTQTVVVTASEPQTAAETASEPKTAAETASELQAFGKRSPYSF